MSFHVDFRGPLTGAKTMPDGTLRVKAHLARTGIQTYNYSDGRTVREYRDASEVFSEDSLDTFRGATLTVVHPNAKVEPRLWRSVAVGHVGDDARRDGDLLAATLYIKDDSTIARVKSGELVEISCGYDCKMVPEAGRTDSGEEYDARQTQVRANHVALGPANWGRAGRNVRLYLDSKETQPDSASIAFSTTSEDSSTMTDEEKKAKAEADKKAAEAKAKEEADRKESELAAEKALAEQAAKVPAVTPEAVPAPTQPEPGQVKPPGNIDSADAVKFDSAVDERLEVLDSARKVIPGFDHKGKSNAQIRREVVEAKGLKTDSKSDDYVTARFDSLVEEALKQDAADGALGNVRTVASNPVVKTDKAESAREKMVRENNEAWKNKTKPRGQK